MENHTYFKVRRVIIELRGTSACILNRFNAMSNPSLAVGVLQASGVWSSVGSVTELRDRNLFGKYK